MDKVADNSFADEQQLLMQKNFLRRTRVWQIIYIALFTSLLASFILLISLVELEGSLPKRNYQKFASNLYESVSQQSKNRGLDWITAENTLIKGIKFKLSSEVFEKAPLFKSARAKVNPRYLPYIVEFSEMLKAMNLQEYSRQNQKLVDQIEAAGYDFALTIRIEGHTDARPLAKTARFANNVELSTFRAYAMMELIRIYTGLPKNYFSIAGYGSFLPLKPEEPEHEDNRRVEIYLIPQMIPKVKSDEGA